jgi:hypothetical protein
MSKILVKAQGVVTESETWQQPLCQISLSNTGLRSLPKKLLAFIGIPYLSLMCEIL